MIKHTRYHIINIKLLNIAKPRSSICMHMCIYMCSCIIYCFWMKMPPDKKLDMECFGNELFDHFRFSPRDHLRPCRGLLLLLSATNGMVEVCLTGNTCVSQTVGIIYPSSPFQQLRRMIEVDWSKIRITCRWYSSIPF